MCFVELFVEMYIEWLANYLLLCINYMAEIGYYYFKNTIRQ